LILYIFKIFPTDGISGVKNLNTCVLDFWVVTGLVGLRSWLFLWLLICGLLQVLYLSFLVNV